MTKSSLFTGTIFSPLLVLAIWVSFIRYILLFTLIGGFPASLRDELVRSWMQKSEDLGIKFTIDSSLRDLADPTFIR